MEDFFKLYKQKKGTYPRKLKAKIIIFDTREHHPDDKDDIE